MRILVIGSGGREHAMVKALKRSTRLTRLWCADGNGGIMQDVECLTLPDAASILAFSQKEKVDLVIIGPEKALVDGVTDALRAAGIAVFGPSKAAAQLEASKGFTKDLCRTYGIPTGNYARFTDTESAKDYVARQPMPLVIKADGLASGKGVVICTRRREAERTIDEMFSGKFGEASASIVIEEFLEGEEVSFFALCDGTTAVEFGAAQDHKAAYDGDKGPNTGGMGTYSPAPVATPAIRKEIMQRIILPTMHAMAKEGIPYQGVLFAGLMITRDGPKLIEYNARFGDPETQVLMARLDEDLAELLLRVAEGKLPNRALRFRPEAAVCVVMAANGYPNEYQKGSEIKNLAAAEALEGVTIYHAGTRSEDGKILANGGRVLGITALGSSVEAAQTLAYKAVDLIDWPEGFCRRDIGWRAIGRDAA
ncbi:MAG: phosphoribosylamine--glycine ligase [Rickettsiales bacterium]|nr:phosphoribosylamine--glycine ligase [Rickettsiales bacterium]